jgi:hypothetical protein
MHEGRGSTPHYLLQPGIVGCNMSPRTAKAAFRPDQGEHHALESRWKGRDERSGAFEGRARPIL